MSRPIDEKIVQLTLDNKQFEKNAEQSIQTFKNMNKDLSNGQVDMSGITNSVQKISDRFTLLGNISQEVLQRIAYTAVETGQRLISSLSIDNINAGWAKYNELVQSTQTIMSATGKDIGYVNGYLEQLNWFTDETSYNFSDMASNIGKFTSAGVDLKTATSAMQGIATWAAISGQNARSASSAMYNFSQALGSGTMLAQDWRSIENANMATKEFKEIAIEAGLAIGTLKKGEDGLVHAVDSADGSLKDQVVTAENLRETLSDKWFTKDVMIKTLDVYGGFASELQTFCDETGLIASEMLNYIDDYMDKTKDKKKVIDDFAKDTGVTAEEAKKILDKLSSSTYDVGRKAFKAAQEAKTFGEALDSVKDAASTSFMNMFQTIFGNYEEAKELWTGLANGLYDIFIEPLNNLNDLLSSWKELGGRTAVLNGLKNALEGINKVIKPVKEAFSGLIPTVTAEQLVDLSKKFENLTKKFSEMDFSKWENLWSKVSEYIKKIKEYSEETNNVIEDVFNKIKGLGGKSTGFGSFIKGIVDNLSEFLNLTNLLKAGEIAVFIKSMRDLINTGTGIKNFFNIFRDAKEAFSEGGLMGVLFGAGKQEGMSSVSPLETFVNGIKNIGTGFKLTGIALIGIAIKQLADAVNTLGNLDFESAMQGITIISIVMGELVAVTKYAKSSLRASFSMMMIATAVDMLAIAIAGLSFIDGNKLASSLLAIGGALTELVITTLILGKMEGPLKSLVAGGTLLLLAVAIDMLSLAIAGLALIDGNKLLSSVTVIGIALAELVIAVALLGQIGGSLQAIAGGVAFVLLAASIDILTGALVALSFIDPEKLGMSLIMLAGALGILIAASYALEGAVVGVLALAGAGIALALVAGSLLLFAGACKVLETVDWSTFGASFGGALGLIALGLIAMTPAVSGALALTLAGAGLLALATSLVMLKSVDIASIAPGISNMLLALAMGLTLMIVALPGAMALTVASIGLLALAEAVKNMNSLDMATMADGLLKLMTALAAGLTLMIVSLPGALGLLVAAPALIILASALTRLQSIGMDTIGPQLGSLLTYLAEGLTLMIVSLPGALGLLVAAPALIILGKALETFNKFDAGEIGQQLGSLLVYLAEGLTLMIVSLPGAIALLTACKALVTLSTSLEMYNSFDAGSIGKQIGEFLTYLAEGLTLMILSEAGAMALKTVAPTITVLADGIRNIQYLPIETVGSKLQNFMSNLSTGLNAFKGSESGSQELINVITSLGQLSDSLEKLNNIRADVLNGFNSININDWSVTFSGMTEAITASVNEARDILVKGLEEIGTSITDITTTLETNAKEAGTSLVSAFSKGISGSQAKAKNKAKSVGDASATALSTGASYSKGYSTGQNFIQGFINGMNSKLPSAELAAQTLGQKSYEALKKAIKEGSPSKLTFKSGGYFDDGFINGITSKLTVAQNAASKLGEYALYGLDNSGALNPTVSPIIDMDKIKAMEFATEDIQMNLNGISKIQNGFNPVIETFNDMQKQIIEANNKIVKSINELNEKLNEYIDKPFPEIGMYVDGKQLASSIAKPMNQQLGILGKRR